MIRRACYECGRPVTLPDDAFRWECVCGFDERTRAPQQALVARYREDALASAVLDELLDAYEVRCAPDAEAERVAVAAVARKVDSILAGRARIVAARTPDPTRMPELVELTRGLDGEAAWRKLAALGHVPDDGQRKFWTDHGIDARPDSLDVCLAFACDVPAALAAERHFRAFCAAAGLHADVVWSYVLETGYVTTIPTVREAFRRCVPRGIDEDIDSIAVAAELYPQQPNPFAALLELYATGVSVDADRDGDISLCLA